MLMNALPAELLVQVLMHLEPEELSRCDQLCKLFHGPPSLVERALRLLATQGGLGGIPETLPNNRANWTQALLFLAILQRGSRYKLVAAGDRRSLFVNEDGTLLICGNVDGGTSIRAFQRQSQDSWACACNRSLPSETTSSPSLSMA